MEEDYFTETDADNIIEGLKAIIKNNANNTEPPTPIDNDVLEGTMQNFRELTRLIFAYVNTNLANKAIRDVQVDPNLAVAHTPPDAIVHQVSNTDLVKKES